MFLVVLEGGGGCSVSKWGNFGSVMLVVYSAMLSYLHSVSSCSGLVRWFINAPIDRLGLGFNSVLYR